MIDNVADPGSAEALTCADFAASMYDRRRHHTPYYAVKENGKRREIYYQPLLRPWSKVTGITLHQTACRMGENLPRYNRLGAHFGVTRTGRVLRMADLNRTVIHGNGWNAQCVGIEVDGLYAGLEDDPSTLPDESLQTTWQDKSTPGADVPDAVTEAAMAATRSLVRWIVAEAATKGAVIGVLCAHRQSSIDRRNDPGEAIWKAVALPLHAELELSDGGPGFKIGDGYAVPAAWGGAAGIRY